MHFVHFIAEFIRPGISGYHKLLMEDFENSPNYAEMVNKLFYSNFSFQEFLVWHRKIGVVDFDELDWMGVRDKRPEYCRLEDLNLFGHQFKYIKDIGTKSYQFFRQDTYNSFETAVASFPRPYFLIKENFVEYFDDLIFSSLPSFKKNNISSQIEKELFEGVSIVFDRMRNDMSFSSLPDYFFPDLLFKINGKVFKCNLQTDLKSFTFCRRSFLFLYNQYVTYTTNEHQRLIPHYRKDEPFIFQIPGEDIFLVTNSQMVLDNGNIFILLVAELFLHYYNVFEKWAKEYLKENYTKIISHPDFQY
ncbi:hypothetical protein [[Flexibacter] sp. ATCC 35208]|uniref:hypothetical protein n=1 Tax=[Flexibacter] sp. ATCC 35208 TaxID=1936242 RepID=UPI0009CBB9D5|nr:hypothetical protein [[Flexibacter] sp. ATCC 35208]OMP76214.1 hypothetical protein BW716_25890 [[Flexibacter] sp. ATCC 35208]